MRNAMPAAIEEREGQLQELLLQMASEGMHHAARGISDMVGEPLTVTKPVVRQVRLMDIPNLFGGPETEAVGIYLRTSGEIAGQIMMIAPLSKAFELVDMIQENEPGTTQTLEGLQRSALAELGNLITSFFLNAIDAALGFASSISTPAVLVDMIGAILDILVATSDGLSETLSMIQGTFMRGNREAQLDFWLIPDYSTVKIIANKD